MKCRLPMKIGTPGGGSAAPSPVAVTITGEGNTTYCYATINGTKYYGAGSYEVMPGDKITFGVYGRNTTNYGRVTIDGQQVLNVTNQTTQTYEWTVPDDISAITMQMSYTSSSYSRNGRIVVTTTKKPSGGGDSGGGTSECAVTISETNNLEAPLSMYIEYGICSITVDKTTVSNTGTFTASSGSALELAVLDEGAWKVVVNGTTVKESSVSGSYSHTISSNIQLLVDQEYVMVGPTSTAVLIFNITTE